MIDARETARRLNHNQRIVMLDLNDHEPMILGCIEVVANTLCKSSKAGRRPALVKACGNGSYILTDAGIQVQSELETLQS